MTKNNKYESAVFSYKFLRLIMMGFGSFLIAVGPMYSYFVATEIGLDDLGDALWPFLTGIAALPAGIYICIVGRKLNKPILTDEDEGDKT